MAPLTRSGARKASEIVMLTLRALQPSRAAMTSTVASGTAVNSSSQRRPAQSARREVRVSRNGSREPAVARSHGQKDLAAPGLGPRREGARRCIVEVQRVPEETSGDMRDAALLLISKGPARDAECPHGIERRKVVALPYEARLSLTRPQTILN